MLLKIKACLADDGRVLFVEPGLELRVVKVDRATGDVVLSFDVAPDDPRLAKLATHEVKPY